MSPDFWATAFVVAAAPGTGVVYTLSAGLCRGFRASLVAAFGCTLGILPHMAAAVTGLAALLYASGLAFAILKFLGVAYLLYMAVRMALDRGALLPQEGASQEGLSARSVRSVVVEAILVNLLNPKLTLFFFAFLPQFVAPGDPRGTLSMLEMGVAFMAVTFAVFAAYGLAAVSVRGAVLSRPALAAGLRRLFAGAFVLLGLRLAFAER